MAFRAAFKAVAGSRFGDYGGFGADVGRANEGVAALGDERDVGAAAACSEDPGLAVGFLPRAIVIEVAAAGHEAPAVA